MDSGGIRLCLGANWDLRNCVVFRGAEDTRDRCSDGCGRYTTPSARDADISEFVDCCSWGTSRDHSVPAYGTVLGEADRRGEFCGSENVVRFGFCFCGSCCGEYLDGDTEACKAGCDVGAAHRVGKRILRC